MSAILRTMGWVIGVTVCCVCALAQNQPTESPTREKASGKAAGIEVTVTPLGEFYGPAVLEQLFEPSPAPGAQGASVPHAPPSAPARAADKVGLRYRIQLLRDNVVREVTDKYKFKSGDRLRFIFETNTEAYLYIYHKGSSGQARVLLPDPRLDKGRNCIRAYRAVSVPPIGSGRWWTLDKSTGEEEIFVFLSKEPLDDLASLVPGEGSYLDDAGWQVVQSKMKDYGSSHGDGSNHIYYDEAVEDDVYGEGLSSAYVLTPRPLLVHRIVLKHTR